MNGGAVLGGMMGFGPVIEEPDEPNFHAKWEERVLGMTVAMGACGQWNIDQGRFARESMPPALYLNSSYYQIWLYGLTKLLKQHKMINTEELLQGKSLMPSLDGCNALEPDNVQRVLMAGSPANREAKHPAEFKVGQQVRTNNSHPSLHTRLPRYARDKVGIISKIHGVHVFPDSSALGKDEKPNWLYKVSFDATTLWGERHNEKVSNPNDKVHLDLWQSYLSVES